MPSRGQQLGKLLNSTGDIVETSLPPKIETFSQSVSNTGKIEKAALGNDVSTIEQVSDISLLTASGNSVGDQRVVGNNLYIWNGSGWFRIALINETPTWDSGGQPLSTYILDADSPQDATVITLAATDPDGFPINYSYVTGGSMDSIATVSQDSSVFTITPKTLDQLGGAGNEGPYTGTITFRASDGVNILPYVSSFTLEFITVITDSKYTTLLATATGTSDNNNITDSSSNSHSITVNGDAHAGTFSPYRSGGYSTYFDGSGDYLSIAQTTDTNLTGDFTVECWVYLNEDKNQFFLSKWTSGNFGWNLFAYGGDSIVFYTGNSGNVGTLIDFNYNPPLQQWMHVAVSRTSNTISGYVNGTRKVVTGNTSNCTSNASLTIGGDGSSWSLNGYLRDVRIVNGTGLYSGTSITIPESPPTAITNTKVLLGDLPYFKDQSALNHAITVNGNVSTKPFSPYDYDEYSEADHGGSVYFDGTGDALRIADNSNIQLGTSPFTIEGWFYCTDTAPTQGILAKRDGSSEYWRWIIAAGNLNFRFQSTGLGSFTCNSVTIPSNTWCHFAVTRDNNNDVRQFVNGISTQSAINSTGNFDISGASLRVGEYELNTGHFNGYISDIKIVKNSALYTSNFTPPTAPLSSSGTELHIKGTDASIIDKAQVNNLKLVGNTTGSTTTNFTGAKSINLTGSNDYLVAESEDILTQDYTIETWIYAATGGFAATGYVFDTRPQTSIQNGISLYMNSNTAYLRINGGTKITSGTTLSDQNWHHVAISRSGSNTKLFFNGSQTGSTYTVLDTIYSPKFFIGIQSYNASAINGVNAYLQDFRFTKGLARYTANFTPPTASLEG